ncbi:MAG: hypothetical protein UT55_C0006G0012 [Candidatus Peregrinibacteria bacterium GW2011_GWE2_39_6]|nr:MAG: hypothetical protein UT36_C0012G0037 [Candidatus Peregrinibacteria bacterium GW2011_GWF2_39_17]KKR26541.1 MAG: hypothetical protein UT55_C0006G0012 [Candidatus Peregrinibacteria bacterium GW2011_GWE2_39_6]
MLSLQELINLDPKNLREELTKAKKEKIKIEMALKMKQDKKTHINDQYKHYIGQIMTLLTLANRTKESTS